MITTEWMVLENGRRIQTICENQMPVYLPTAYLTDVASRSSSPNTPNTYVFHLYKFFTWLDRNRTKLIDLRYKDVKDFRSELVSLNNEIFEKDKVSKITVYNCFSTVIRFLEWCCQEDDNESIFRRKKKVKSEQEAC
jgi:hypothetical protein